MSVHIHVRNVIYSRVAIAFVLSALLAGAEDAANPASASAPPGDSYTQDDSGDWSDPSTWSGGPASTIPGTGDHAFSWSGDVLFVNGDHECYSLENNANTFIGASGSLTVGDGGISTSNFLYSGGTSHLQNEGTIRTSGDLISNTGATSAFYLLPGSQFIVEGDAYLHPPTVGNDTRLFLEGTAALEVFGDIIYPTLVNSGDINPLSFTPHANGATGLTPIRCTNLDLGTNEVLTIANTVYQPVVGDSWTIFEYSGTLTGELRRALVVGPGTEGLGLEMSYDAPGVVTAAVVFTGAGLPSTTAWGQFAIALSVLIAGVVVMTRRRLPTFA